MKFVLCFAAIALIQMMGAEANKMKEHIKECSEELQIPKGMVREAFQAKNFEKPELRCFSACMLKKENLLEPGSKYNIEKLKILATKRLGDRAPEVIKIKEECVASAQGITDECDFARKIETCFLQNVPHPKA
ncbi:general odorant-binding protein 56h-like [Leptopilina boulardi]|uniref:general odorant-binding protein 56h-like n=1 Tax=Leptopilina boulardi TaxID=63433 RepID=UPI0021F572C3|nr:general odorant-binding protein 56h-like [Leptopilina boulardi]